MAFVTKAPLCKARLGRDAERNARRRIPLSVTGPKPLILFAVWTLPLGGYSGRYVRPLLEAFESYKELMTSSEAVWVGDFNSNFVFDRSALERPRCPLWVESRPSRRHCYYLRAA
jgi:hypothetical protein